MTIPQSKIKEFRLTKEKYIKLILNHPVDELVNYLGLNDRSCLYLIRKQLGVTETLIIAERVRQQEEKFYESLPNDNPKAYHEHYKGIIKRGVIWEDVMSCWRKYIHESGVEGKLKGKSWLRERGCNSNSQFEKEDWQTKNKMLKAS